MTANISLLFFRRDHSRKLVRIVQKWTFSVPDEALPVNGQIARAGGNDAPVRDQKQKEEKAHRADHDPTLEFRKKWPPEQDQEDVAGNGKGRHKQGENALDFPVANEIAIDRGEVDKRKTAAAAKDSPLGNRGVADGTIGTGRRVGGVEEETGIHRIRRAGGGVHSMTVLKSFDVKLTFDEIESFVRARVMCSKSEATEWRCFSSPRASGHD
jgi:hypothetical protein